MSYVPQNISVFVAAFSGALSGMGISGKVPSDPVPSSYDTLSLVASAYAQAFDLTWTASPVPTTFDIEMIQSVSEAAWQERAPQAIISATSQAVATYIPVSRALIASIRSGENYLAGQGITPPAVGGVTGVTGSAPIASSGGNAPDISISAATGAAAGSMSAADKTKLDTVVAGAAIAAVSGAAPIIASTGTNSPQISISAATGAAAGSMSAADKTKLDGITSGAAVASVSGSAPIVSSGGATPAISISAATGAAAGSMSAADKTKLDTVSAGAAVASVGVSGAAISSTGGTTPSLSINAATQADPGSMSAADKTKLDGIQKQGVSGAISALDIDWSLQGSYTKALSNGSQTFTFSNAVDGESIVVVLTGSGTSVVVWPTVKWPGGTIPTQTVAGIDVYTFIKVGSTIYGSAVQAMA